MTINRLIGDIGALHPVLFGTAACLSNDDSLKFLEACKVRKINILGADGFRMECGKRIPDFDHIIDMGSSAPSDVALDEVINFINKAPSWMYFEFTIASK